MLRTWAGDRVVVIGDIRQAWRGLRRSPGFAIAAMGSLALGIGANAAVFSAVYALLMRPFPFRDADQLVRISSVRGNTEGPLAVPEQDDLAALGHVIQDIALYTDQGLYNASGFGQPEELPATITTHNLFRVLGVSPAIGTTFPAEFDRSRRFGLVISHALWQRRFGGDPAIVGRTLTLDGAPGYEIFGVLPPGFNFPSRADLFRSAGISGTPANYQRRDLRARMALARLALGVTPAQAQSAIDALAHRLAETYPSTNAGVGFRVTPLRDLYVGSARAYLALVAGTVILVLLVSSVNVANLVLARSVARQQEIAVRLALGATRGRLIVYSLIESAVLAGGGAVLGGGVAWVGVAALNRLLRVQLPPWMTVKVDVAVVGSLIVFASVAALIVGVLPLLRARDVAAQDALRAQGRGASGSRSQERLRRWLVGAEVALAGALLASAGALIDDFARLQAIDLGFDPARTLSFRVELGWRAYDSHEKTIQFNERLLDGLARLPGVVAVGLDSNLAISGMPRDRQAVQIDAQSDPDRRANPYVSQHIISAGYFPAMQIALRRGRGFTDDDRAATAPVALVDERLAERLWPGADAIGGRILVGPPSDLNPWATVVGIVAQVPHEGARAGGLDVYRPFRQLWSGGSWFVARVASDNPLAVAREATSLVAALDPDQSFFDVQTMDARVATSTWRERLAGVLVTAFGVVAGLLALVGIGGLIAYMVRQRAREIGIRLALGAERRHVATHFTAQAAWLIGVGLLGAAVVAGGGIAVTSHLFFMPSAIGSPPMFLLPALLGIAALALSWIFAWRGSGADPAAALRG